METNKNNLPESLKENPFKVPENYFEDFTQKMMSRLPEKEIKMPAKVTMWQKVKPWVYMAAMFIGMFFMVQLFINKPATGNHAPSATFVDINKHLQNDKYWKTVQISEEEFYKYLEDQLAEDGYYDYLYQLEKDNEKSGL